MFKNYIVIALRNILKNRLYAVINIIGLALGLTVYLFGGILADYENNHDTMFKNSDRIYTIGSVLQPTANIGIKEMSTTYTAMGPLIEAAEIAGVEAVARLVRRDFLLTYGEDNYNESINFTDASLQQMFDFDYIAGDETALTDPKGLVVTRSFAEKVFGRTDVVGEVVLLNHTDDLRVQAVIEDLPKNTHFNSFILSDQDMTMLAPLEALSAIADWDIAGNWNNISGGNYMYVMTDGALAQRDLTDQINTVFHANADEEMQQEFIKELKTRQLKETNTAIWDMIGMPVIASIQILGVLVLVIAIVNYTNLASAQSMGRAREVGMRKTLGATRQQLLIQFLVESLTISLLAMMFAIVFLELVVPQFNAATGKVVSLQYLDLLPWLLLTATTVGLLAGAYPSYLITKVTPIDALKELTMKGSRGSLFRTLMIGTQFMLSIFMLASVMIVFFQNEKVKDSSNIYPKDEVVVITGMSKDALYAREETLRNELMALPDVRSVTFATQVPFEQSNSSYQITREKGDQAGKFNINQIDVDHDFLKTFDMPIVAGRDFDRAVSADTRESRDVRQSNVIINEMAARRLGFVSAQDAIGQFFWNLPDEGEPVQHTVIGVMEDQNILGLHNEMKPWVFSIDPGPHFYGAVRLRGGANAATIADIEAVWKRVNPEYPIEHRMLTDMFEDVYEIYRSMNMVLAGFAGLALTLALIGLFGLAAFMARSRTKEIGIRKVLGASNSQLIRLLVLQFSKPVLWAILVALPLAYFASGLYLDFFADRISMQIPIIIASGVLAVFLAWGVIGLHAVRVANRNPILALRYE